MLGRALRVMSANLWNGRADPRRFVELVEAAEIDVVAVQELAPEQAEALAEVLPHGQLEPARDHTGMGLALRWPADHSRVELACRDARVAQLRPAIWPELDRPVEIINVHIVAPHVPPPPRGLMQRRKQVLGLERYLLEKKAATRLLLGDFNATPLWPAYRRISSHLTDVAVASAQQLGTPVRATWGPWSGAPRLLRIDHAFSCGLAIEGFQVVHVAGADHSAIVMDLSFPVEG